MSFAEALMSTEVASRDSHGGEGRIKAARFPARKTLEEFDSTFQRSVKKTVVEHLGQLDFLHAKDTVILLGPPGAQPGGAHSMTITLNAAQVSRAHAPARNASTSAANSAWCWKRKPCAASG